jgi:hypothetical protein
MPPIIPSRCHTLPVFDRDVDWIPALQRLDGEFGRDTSDRVWMRAFGPLLVAFLLWSLLSEHDALDIASRPAVFIVPGLLLVFSAWAWREAGTRYRFQLGMLTCLGSSGRVRWERSLSDLQSVQTRSSRSGEYLKLTWPKGRKYLALGSELEEAIRVQMRLLHPGDARYADPEEESNSADSDDPLTAPTDPPGPNWRCAKCGEDNPGNFDVCWKCETARPAAP